MIKALIVMSGGFHEHPIINPDIEGAKQEEYIIFQSVDAGHVSEYHQEARIDSEGVPYIHSWREEHPRTDYKEWCDEGFDHSIEEIEITNPAMRQTRSWTYSRKVKKTRWILELDNMDQLSVLLQKYDAELSYDQLVQPGISYVFRVYE